ncbi:MAG: hypothetical protein GQ522_05470, partial [Deltaproteobacteria bacterium]|nr:hypothetical protein [Deltaproteobacteria bacterium]
LITLIYERREKNRFPLNKDRIYLHQDNEGETLGSIKYLEEVDREEYIKGVRGFGGFCRRSPYFNTTT